MSENLAGDVLQGEHHTDLSAEEIAKALERHNRKHKGDANKAHMQSKSASKKK